MSEKILARLDELAKVEDGWLDGSGKACDAETMEFLKLSLPAWISSGMPKPHLYLTEEGQIRMEWDIDGWSVSADFDAVNIDKPYKQTGKK